MSKLEGYCAAKIKIVLAAKKYVHTISSTKVGDEINISEIKQLTGYSFSEEDLSKPEKIEFLSLLLESAIKNECKKHPHKGYNYNRHIGLRKIILQIEKKHAELNALHAQST